MTEPLLLCERRSSCVNVVSRACTRSQVLAASGLEGDKRLTLSFRSSQYSPQTLLGRDVSSTLPPLKVSFPEIPGTNAGWVDTTFIDEEIRVARAFGGNLFVLARV